MTKVIQLVGHAGAGKSVIAFNLGVELAKKHHTTLVDADLYSSDVSQFAGLHPDAYLNEHIRGEKSVDELITQHPSGLHVIPSIAEETYSEELHNKVNDLILQLYGKSEIVLVDSFSHNPALCHHLDRADECIFVTNDDYHNISKAKDMMSRLEDEGHTIIGVVLNRRGKAHIKNIEHILQKRILAEIKHDPKLIDSINKRQPAVLLHPNASISKAMKNLAYLLSHES